MSVILYRYNIGDFVKDFYELSMILINYELEVNPRIKSPGGGKGTQAFL